MKYIYARVSTNEQNVDQQAQYLMDKYPDHDLVITEKASGKTLDRPQFTKLIESLASGDTLIVMTVDRLGRDAIAVQQVAKELCDRGVSVVVAKLDGVDLSSMAGKIILAVMAQIAEGERATMLERQRIGIERAKAEGKYKGRAATDDKKITRMHEMIAQGLKANEIASALGMGLSTVYKLLKATK